ncbi:hypothetical protein HOLleu_30623 [Holothuria leucospilota]|uniref:Uncharacterized protein n=1 Tax=Holothuria leucospilota TaxID=206669 RepID=A0A9Q1BKR1_HOLLE|nr:hypothetical protein HOLleu_30623 [Holothuria leucospilota]
MVLCITISVCFNFPGEQQNGDFKENSKSCHILCKTNAHVQILLRNCNETWVDRGYTILFLSLLIPPILEFILRPSKTFKADNFSIHRIYSVTSVAHFKSVHL